MPQKKRRGAGLLAAIFPALILVLAPAANILAQATGPDVSAWYKISPSDKPLYKWAIVNRPLSFTVDSAGSPNWGLMMGQGLMRSPDGSASVDWSGVPRAVSQKPNALDACSRLMDTYADETSLLICVANTGADKVAVPMRWASFSGTGPGGITVRMPGSFGGDDQVIGTRPILDIVAGSNVYVSAYDSGTSVVLQVSAPGWCTVDAAGKVVGCTSSYTFGRGFQMTEDSPKEVILDSNYIVSRVPLPSGIAPGACPFGTSSYTQDTNGYEYRCFPKADGTLELRRSQQWANAW